MKDSLSQLLSKFHFRIIHFFGLSLINFTNLVVRHAFLSLCLKPSFFRLYMSFQHHLQFFSAQIILRSGKVDVAFLNFVTLSAIIRFQSLFFSIFSIACLEILICQISQNSLNGSGPRSSHSGKDFFFLISHACE